MLDDLTDFARDAVTTAGYPGILAAMVAENLFPPIPSEVVLPLAGYEVSQGSLAFFATVLVATAGSLIGALVLYAVGRYGGRPAVDRWGRLLRVTHADLDRAERWFDRWGDWAVFIGRITPIVRSFVSVPAGVGRHPLGRYTWLTLIGSTLWCFAFAGAGWAVGSRWEEFHHAFRYADVTVAALLVLAIVALVVRHRKNRNGRRAADPAR